MARATVTMAAMRPSITVATPRPITADTLPLYGYAPAYYGGYTTTYYAPAYYPRVRRVIRPAYYYGGPRAYYGGPRVYRARYYGGGPRYRAYRRW